MGFRTQFKALLKKNWILWHRNLGGSLCELIFPIILWLLMVVIRRLVKNENHIEQSYAGTVDSYYMDDSVKTLYPSPSSLPDFLQIKMGTMYPNNPFYSCACLNKTIFALVGSSSLYPGIQAALGSYSGVLSKATMSQFTVRSFATVEEMEDYVTDINYEERDSMRGLCAAIQIEEIPGVKYDIHLRFDDNNYGYGNSEDRQTIPTTRLPVISVLQRIPDKNAFDYYHYSGFTFLQYLLSQEILNQLAPGTKIRAGISPMHTPFYIKDAFLEFAGEFCTFIITLSYMTPVFKIVSMIVLEKEAKTREGMKMMGLKDSAYWLSFFVYYIVILFVIAAEISIIIRVEIFTYVNWFLTFLFFFIYGLSIFAFALCMSALFSRARVASITATMLYFASSLVFSLVKDADISQGTKVVSSLLPTVASSLGCLQMVRYEEGQFNLNLSNAADLIDNFRFSMSMIMLVVDFAIFILLGLYLDNVIPSPLGVRQHPLFFLSKAYWTGHAGEDNSVADSQENSEDVLYPKGKPFEKVMETLKDQEKSRQCLVIRHLQKHFGSKHVVCDFSVNIYKGQIFALLGPNGAGKTTTLSMLTGLLEADSGSAYSADINVFREMSRMREQLGVCPQHDVLFEKLTPREHLEMFASFKGREDTTKIQEDVKKILADCDLTASQDMITAFLSGGQQRKLSIGIAFIGDSPSIFLDEPTSGMDMSARRGVWEMLKKYKEGKVIILTTHFMEEAEVLGDRIGIMTLGTLRCVGSPLYLKTHFGVGYNVIVVKKDGADTDTIFQFFKERLADVKKDRDASKEITIRVPKKEAGKFEAFFTELDQKLDELKIQSYGMASSTMEEIFLRVARNEGIVVKDTAQKAADPAKPEGERFAKKMKSEVMSGSMGVLNQFDTYCLADQPEETFWAMFPVQFFAIFLKRWIISIRTWMTMLIEILVPIILVVFGFVLTLVKTYYDGPARWLTIDQYPTPQYANIYYHESQSIDSVNEIVNLLSGANTDIKPTYLAIPTGDETSMYNYMEAGIYAARGVDPCRYQSLYLRTISPTLYEYVVYVNMSSQEASGAFMGIYTEAILRKATGKNNLDVKFANHPLPLPFKARNMQQAIDGDLVSSTLVIAFALIPASVIAFIVKEREDNLKHQQLISGVSLTAYWLSNSAMDLFKSVLPCVIGIALIYAFDISLPSAWVLILIYGFTIVPFTYFTSFFFTRENLAQTMTLLIHFFAGVVLGPIFTIFRYFDSTRDAGKALGWIFRIIPSFSLSYGIKNLSGKKVFASLEKTGIPNDMDIDCAGGDLIFICISFPIYTILVILIEAGVFNRCLKRLEPKDDPNDTEKNRDEDVKKIAEKCETVNLQQDPPAIIADKLRKRYKLAMSKSKLAVDKVSFMVRKGECFALLGTNGAGKTTTFKMLTMDLLPTQGQVLVLGKELMTSFPTIRRMIGYGPQYESSYPQLTTKENLLYYAKIKGIKPPSFREELVNDLLSKMQLEKYQDTQAGQLSGGNRRKLTVAIAVLGNPLIVLLDEPSTGVDPEAKRCMWHIISTIALRQKKSAVIMTTHSMEEAEALCSHMSIMVDGNLKCYGTPQYLKEKFGKGFEIQFNVALPEFRAKLALLNKAGIGIKEKERAEVAFENRTLENVGEREEKKVNEEEKKSKKENMKDTVIEKELEKVLMTQEQINAFFDSVGQSYLKKEIAKDGYASDFYSEFQAGKLVKALAVANFALIEKEGWSLAREITHEFDRLTVPEHYNNYYKWRVEKKSEHQTIGKLFALMQRLNAKYNIAEYSASQTSLSQIFHAISQGAETGNEKKVDRVIQKGDFEPSIGEIMIGIPLGQNSGANKGSNGSIMNPDIEDANRMLDMKKPKKFD